MPLTRIVTLANPLANASPNDASWGVVFAGQRWFGPDTLLACIEARDMLEQLAQDVVAGRR